MAARPSRAMYSSDIAYLAGAGRNPGVDDLRRPMSSASSKRSAPSARAPSEARSDFSVDLHADANDDRHHSSTSPAINASAHNANLRDSSSLSRFSRDDVSIAGRTEDTAATSVHTLPPLQARGPSAHFDTLDPVAEDDLDSYDLVEPATESDMAAPDYSLEDRVGEIYSAAHLRAIFADPTLLLRFTSFLGAHRRTSVPVLIYYLDTLKAIKAIGYANAVAGLLEPIEGLDFSHEPTEHIKSAALQKRADQAFNYLLEQELPAYVTHVFINYVSASVQQRITGKLPPHLREASEGLAEVFCLTDPSRRDNPIVFASEEFHRTTQYGVGHAIGRNCRFLQGPKTSMLAIERLAKATKEGRDHSETFINYRRDGSPFLNLLMVAPLRDSRGTLRYFIGAQVDVSGLAKECTGLDALQRLLANDGEYDDAEEQKSEFQELAEMLNLTELDCVRHCGGRMHRQHADTPSRNGTGNGNSWQQPRLLLKDDQLTPPDEKTMEPLGKTVHGRLVGVYSHYLLVRPYPSLRILFTSPSLRLPGILQSPFMDRVGSSERVREELLAALAAGRGVTAKVRWLANAHDEHGRNRWLHCTPLLGASGDVGVWMVVLVDDASAPPRTRFKEAPPVAASIPRNRDLDGARYAAPLRPGSSASSRAVPPQPPSTAAPESEVEYPNFGRPSIVPKR